MRRHLLAPVVLEHRGDEVPLHIGRRAIGHDGPEAPRLGIGRGHHAGALAAVLDDRGGHAQRALEGAADGDVALGLPAGDVVDMVLEIAADRGAIEHHVDPVLLEMRGRADAGEHQDLRAIERACAQYHAAPRQQRFALATAPDLDAGDAPRLDHQLLDQRVSAHREVAELANRLHVSARRRPAFALALGDLVEPEAVLPLAVEIGVGAQLQRGCGIDEGVAGGVGVLLVGDEQRPARAVEVVTPALVRLGALEIGEHVVIAPAGAALGRPVVVIPAVAADIDHRVDRRGTAQAPPARLIAGAPVQPLLRHRLVAIVRVLEQEGHEARRLHQNVVVAPARFKQTHPARAVHRETPRDSAARAATADDDVVETFHDLSLWAGRLGSFLRARNRVSIRH